MSCLNSTGVLLSVTFRGYALIIRIQDSNNTSDVSYEIIEYNQHFQVHLGDSINSHSFIVDKNPPLNLSKHKKIPVHNSKVKVEIKNNTDKIIFHVFSKQTKKNLKVAFYLFKDGVRVDKQWYSENFTYTLNKQKYGSGKYRIKYFIITGNVNNPSKKKEKETGYSKYILID